MERMIPTFRLSTAFLVILLSVLSAGLDPRSALAQVGGDCPHHPGDHNAADCPVKDDPNNKKCDSNGDGEPDTDDWLCPNETCYRCDTNGDGVKDSCHICDTNNDGVMDNCYICDTNDDQIRDSCFLCDTDGAGGPDDCYVCDTNDDEVPDSCNYQCNTDNVPGNDACFTCDTDDDEIEDSCYVCDSDGNGILDSCLYLCDSNGIPPKEACYTCDKDGDGKVDTCSKLCDTNFDKEADSCYVCDNDGNTLPDGCWECDTNNDKKPDTCYTCDSDDDGVKDICHNICNTDGVAGADSCYVCDSDGDGNEDTCSNLCDTDGVPGKDSCFVCDDNNDDIPDACFACDMDGQPGFDACLLCDTDDDGLNDSCTPTCPSGECDICDSDDDGNPDSCSYLCDTDGVDGPDSCYTCDSDGDGNADTCQNLCDTDEVEGADSCFVCDRDHDGIPDQCAYICDTDGEDGADSCFVCDSDNDKIDDSCYQCNTDKDDILETCFTCDYDNNGINDYCFVLDTDVDGVKDSCEMRCDTNEDGVPDSESFLCDTDGDFIKDSCYKCDTNNNDIDDSCQLCDADGNGVADSCKHLCDTDWDGKHDECFVCDNDGDQKPDSCFKCDTNNDDKFDDCFKCDSDDDGVKDSCEYNCNADGVAGGDECFVCDSDDDGNLDTCDYQCDTDGVGGNDKCFVCDNDNDDHPDACFACDLDGLPGADACLKCDTDLDGIKDSCSGSCPNNECFICDTNDDGIADSCDYQCNLDKEEGNDSCFVCDTNDNGNPDSCLVCDTDDVEGNDSCYRCDTTNDGYPDQCEFTCDSNPHVDGLDSCYVCDSDGNGHPDQCAYLCDTDGDEEPDSCFVCDTDGDEINDGCYTCDTDDDEIFETCYTCDTDDDQINDMCFTCDNDGDGKNEYCYACDTDSDGILDGCFLFDKTGDGINDACTIDPPDIDVDSDNDSAYGSPGRDEAEDQIEDTAGNPLEPGKLVVVNDDDGDEDGFPDFADGFTTDQFQNPTPAPPTAVQGERFVQATIELPEGLDQDAAEMKLVYSDSDPDQVVRAGAAPEFVYTPAPGHLRLWRKPGHEGRDPESFVDGGDFVPASESDGRYGPADLEKLFPGSTREVTLYLEAVRPSASIADLRIEVYIDPDGIAGPLSLANYTDAVRVTAIKVDLDGDGNHKDGITDDNLDDSPENRLPGVIVLCNTDDDNDNGELDNGWLEIGDTSGADASDVNSGAANNDFDDFAPVILRRLLIVPAGWELRLSLVTPTNVAAGVDEGEVVRIFSARANGAEPLLGPGTTSFVVPEDEAHDFDLTALAATDRVVGVEGLEFASEVKLRVQLLDTASDVYGADEIQLKVAPLLLLHHLQGATESYVCNVGGLESADYSGARFPGATPGGIADHIIPLALNGGDQWAQDEFQICYQDAPYKAMYVVLDSKRHGGLRAFPPESTTAAQPGLLGPDHGWIEINDGSVRNSLDSFGNLEVSPPCTVGGTEYPFGRIYYGDGVRRVDAELRDFLDRQQIQSPVLFNSDWLAVGHVDEFMSIVPDAAGTHGWKVLIASPLLGADTLAAVDANLHTPRYVHYGAGINTTSALLARAPDAPTPGGSATIEDYNRDETDVILYGAAAGRDGGIKADIRTAFGLANTDFIEVPVLFNFDSKAVAITPDLANGSVYPGVYIAPNNFLHNPAAAEEDADSDFILDAGEDANGNGLLDTRRDPFHRVLDGALPAGIGAAYIDDWMLYHTLDGEVHCSSNERRSLPADHWWETTP